MAEPAPITSVLVGHTADGGIAALRPIRGREELAVTASGTPQAIALIDALLEATPWTTIQPGQAAQLVAADRDKLLAAIYRQAFGDEISRDTPCTACGTPFETSFTVDGLEAAAIENSNASGVAPPGDDGWRPWHNGIRFRLPTGVDECIALATCDPEATLRERCIEGDATPEQVAQIGSILATLTPILSLDLVATCPTCGTENPAPLAMQDHLLQSVLAEREMLLRDIDVLARRYHWGQDDILDLERSHRRHLVALASGPQRGAGSAGDDPEDRLGTSRSED